jgi:diguanylate cyclase (GGDEF)-like protein/PAS domain S-box-containing protein
MSVIPKRGTADTKDVVDSAELSEDLTFLRGRVQQLEAALLARGQSVSDTEENRFQDFARATEGWFWETDAELRFTYMSPNVFDIVGVEPEWHYGKTREELGAPENLSEEAWRTHLETLRRREPFADYVFERLGPAGRQWMRTSGFPIYDENGDFCGYRGSAMNVTNEVEAKRKADLLKAAIENLSELFVLWDEDDRLVLCNRHFRDINERVIDTTQPGTKFEDHITAALAAGMYPNAAGRENEWLEERMERHRNPTEPFELKRQDGRWLLLREQKLINGSTATISTDITDRKEAEARVEGERRFLEAALRTIPDGVQVLDKDFKLVAWNNELFEVMNLDKDAVLNSEDPLREFMRILAARGEYGEGDVEEQVDSRLQMAYDGLHLQYERQLTTGKWLECRGGPVEGGGYFAVYRDIDERKRFEHRLEELATKDGLTGIFNRRHFLTLAEAELSRSNRHGHQMSFLLLDIDYFKAINDQYGHAAGDEALRMFADICLGTLRISDQLGRFGGEEFIVFLPETDITGATIIADRLRLNVAAAKVKYEDVEFSMTVSIGVTQLPENSRNTDDVIAAADGALYEAKRGGRNRVVVRQI